MFCALYRESERDTFSEITKPNTWNFSHETDVLKENATTHKSPPSTIIKVAVNSFFTPVFQTRLNAPKTRVQTLGSLPWITGNGSARRVLTAMRTPFHWFSIFWVRLNEEAGDSERRRHLTSICRESAAVAVGKTIPTTWLLYLCLYSMDYLNSGHSHCP